MMKLSSHEGPGRYGRVPRRVLLVALAIAAILSVAVIRAVIISTEATRLPDPSADPTADVDHDEAGGPGVDPSAPPAEWPAPVAVDLQLDTVSVEEFELGDDEGEALRYCFSDRLADVRDGERLVLIGIDPTDQRQAVAARVIDTAPACLLVRFPADTDITQYALAHAGPGAVSGSEDRPNTPRTVAIPSARLAGESTVPELDDVVLDAVQDQIDFVFDEVIEPASVSEPGQFGFFTRSADFVAATRLVSVTERIVTVAFDRGAVEEAVRPAVSAGAVRDEQGTPNPALAGGGATTGPDPVRARRSTATRSQFEVTFDEPVSAQTSVPDRFEVLTVAGRSVRGRTVETISPRTLRISLTEPLEGTDQPALLSVQRGAVEANEVDGVASTSGIIPLGASGFAGPTAGPDLTEVSIEPRTGRVALTFDEPLAEDLRPDPGSVVVVTASGQPVRADRLVAVDQRRLTVNVSMPDVESAALVALDGGVVTSPLGTPNPPATVDIRAESPSAAGRSSPMPEAVTDLVGQLPDFARVAA